MLENLLEDFLDMLEHSLAMFDEVTETSVDISELER
jgi:hypothetical protein